MQSEDFFRKEYDRAKKMLSVDCKVGNGVLKGGNKIVLFLGSGINGSGMTWNKIIKSPMDKALKRFCHETGMEVPKNYQELNFSAPMQASFIKYVSKTAYINQLRDFIYDEGPKRKDIEELIESKGTTRDRKWFTLYALAKIIVENNNVEAVVTQNYDKFLTYAVDEYARARKASIKCVDVSGTSYGDERNMKWRHLTGYSNDFDARERVLPILHVHGYLAPYNELQESLKGDEIVMAGEEFFGLFKDSNSWLNTSQLHYLSHYTCVFAGLSFDDLTSQRILNFVKNNGDRTHNKYYLTACDKNCEGFALESLKNHIKASIYRELGVTTMMSIDGFTNLFADVIECMTEEKQ